MSEAHTCLDHRVKMPAVTDAQRAHREALHAAIRSLASQDHLARERAVVIRADAPIVLADAAATTIVPRGRRAVASA